MAKERIGVKELFALIILFELGTALVIPIGFAAGQNVWVSVLLALIGGILLFLLYNYFAIRYPGLSFSLYTQKILGKYIGWAMSLLYIPLFIYIAARDLREAGGLLLASTYDRTPLFAINALMMIAVIYTVRKGIEVLARMAEIYLIIMIILGVLGNIFVLLSGIIEPKNLLPLFPHGLKPILTTAYPNILIFPFGEMVCFTTILPYLNKKSQAATIGLSAIIIGGMVLTINSIILLCVLGPETVLRSSFPALTAVSYINIASFIQRLDTFILILMVILGFVKITIYFFCAVIGTADLFRMKPSVTNIYLIGGVIFFSSLMIAPSYQAHINEGLKIVPYLLHLPFHIAIPILLLITAYIKQKIKPTLL